MKYLFVSALLPLLAFALPSRHVPGHKISASPLTYKNGLLAEMIKSDLMTQETLVLDGGWYKFYFGGENTTTAYTFFFNHPYHVQISITDAYCPGDAFDLYQDGEYLISTPRVRSDNCVGWTDDPNKAFVDAQFSSTKFALPPGPFNLTIHVLDSPFKGGAAFIRADSYTHTCRLALAPFILVTHPMEGYASAKDICKRVGAIPANIDPSNSMNAAQSLVRCGYSQSWFGKLSLKDTTTLKAGDLGCLAFSAANPLDPTVTIVECTKKIPVLCQIVP